MNEPLKPGMALGVQRIGYKHYGIYAGVLGGWQCVIHYNGKPGTFAGRIELASLSEFIKDDKWWVETFDGVSYSDIICRQSFARASSRLTEQQYNLVFNNCEHFASWCVTGQQQSKQITEALDQLFTEPKQAIRAKLEECAIQFLGKAAQQQPIITVAAVLGTIVLVKAASQKS